MILGTGIDIIEVERIRSALTRHGDRFVERVLHPEELAYCRLHRDPGPFVAVRFAAKEAVSKAFGTGIGAELGWHDMEVRRKETGDPYLILHGKGETLFARRGAAAVHITLSHTTNHATAMAVLEGAA